MSVRSGRPRQPSGGDRGAIGRSAKVPHTRRTHRHCFLAQYRQVAVRQLALPQFVYLGQIRRVDYQFPRAKPWSNSCSNRRARELRFRSRALEQRLRRVCDRRCKSRITPYVLLLVEGNESRSRQDLSRGEVRIMRRDHPGPLMSHVRDRWVRLVHLVRRPTNPHQGNPATVPLCQ